MTMSDTRSPPGNDKGGGIKKRLTLLLKSPREENSLWGQGKSIHSVSHQKIETTRYRFCA